MLRGFLLLVGLVSLSGEFMGFQLSPGIVSWENHNRLFPLRPKSMTVPSQRRSGLLLTTCKEKDSAVGGVREKRRPKRKAKAAAPQGKPTRSPVPAASSPPLRLTAEQESHILSSFADDLALSLEEIVEAAEKQSVGGSVAAKKKGSKGRAGKEDAGLRTRRDRSERAGQEREQGRGKSVGVSVRKQLEFERNGHVKLDEVLAGCGVEAGAVRAAFDEVFEARAKEAYLQKLRVFGASEHQLARHASAAAALAAVKEVCEREGREVPFFQLFHLERGPSQAAQLLHQVAHSEELGGMAAALLGVERVRLYQTAAFVKQPEHGETAWHSDLNTSPLDTNAMLTLWLPLTPVPDLDHSPLEFASGSHRDFALAYWYSNEGMEDLASRDYTICSHLPLRPGDCTAHHGWLLHSSPPNFTSQARKAFTISYVADGARRLDEKGLRRRPDDEDLEGYAGWLSRVRPGARVDAALPLVYDARKTSAPSSPR